MSGDSHRSPTADRPAHDANYDHQSTAVARPELLDDLQSRIEGDARFDTYTRQLYATDASAYEVTPIGVVFPRSTADVARVMDYCAKRSIPVLPRGGGTSLAGQAVNEAVVLDFTRYMDSLVDIDPDARTARAQPGCYLGDIDEALEPHGLKFAPDPAWGDKSALGGAIGNNSTGAHSLVYGKTDAYVESCEVVLADGTVTEFGECTIEDLRDRADPAGDLEARIHAAVARILDEETDTIENAYPDLKRNVSGYDLDRLVEDARETQHVSERASSAERSSADRSSGQGPREDGGTASESGSVNLARLLCGSEGTLAIVTEATVSLEPIPETKAVALLTYDSLGDAMADVTAILEHDPAAVEVMDDVLLDLARDTSEFADVVGMLPDETDSVLLVEFYADSNSDGRQQVADLIADRVPDGDPDTEPSDGAAERTDEPRYARGAMEAHDADTRARFWKLRKSGLPILLSRTSDAKHISFIEDCAVPADRLPEYVAGFQEILDDNDTFASFYAHAGPGVLHVRPLIDTKTVDGVETMERIADAVTDLVVDLDGSVSGEHGDGRARTQWNRKLYGDHLWEVFRDLKRAFDPDWLLNPGQVCGFLDEAAGDTGEECADAPDLAANLRFDPDYEFDAGFDPVLQWDNENGFEGMAELCHGCGGCRGHQSTTGGTMCPTYRAAEEEILSTRGRANLLRQAMSGDLAEDEAFDVEFMNEVMDLCIGCKGCVNDCPSEVDMAKMKAEVTHEHHQRHGVSLRDRVFANIDRLSALGSRLAPLSNWASEISGARTVLEKTVGIAAERSLPTFHDESFEDWFEARGGAWVPASDAERQVLLFPDTYTNYNHPEAGKAAVRVLEAAGVHIRLPLGVADSGRPAFSKGFLDKARAAAEQNVAALAPLTRRGWDVVVVEPSDAVMFQSDYPDLLGGDDESVPTGTVPAGEGGEQPATDGGSTKSDVEVVARSTYGVMEYVDRLRLDEALDAATPDESLTYHGHCHQKATKKDHHAVGVLRRAGYDIDPLDSGCCGMAGSFGYEAEHLSMSRAIADVLFDQVGRSDGDRVVAPGASCRSQLGERADSEPPHPVEKLAETL
ncbi:FAD-binding and (Fe-S)-binding domain-containing protein [Halococcus saccharolyticus]|uniref:D-lactate dehydrogenase (cytochrome) n=1 Tax=Halococcus saccharolyticus DSM 5350 TaxID=1227455 RepID=M0MEM0_9EURY|nr:FAD-binding and (Fe-S)-binding domain-containing protein [Halococcus saccharolyticus]EMA44207.1 fad/fmn-dependent dehydrogenase [Halococcus saccharolyticus DSM 5350]